MNDASPYRGMRHWNRNCMVAIHAKYTGPDPEIHELLEISFVPVDYDFKPLTYNVPLTILFKPEMPCDKAPILGVHPIDAISGFDQWCERLKLAPTRWGTDKQLIPLCWSWPQLRPYLVRWLGHDYVNLIFHHSYRDVSTVAAYLNDRGGEHAETVPYSKIELSWILKTHNLQYDKNTVSIANALAKVYKAMVAKGMF